MKKKQVNFKVHFGLVKAFLDHVFFFFFHQGGWGGGSGLLMENSINLFFLNHPLSADYNERIESCTKFLRENENLKSDKVQTLKNLDGKTLKVLETLDFHKEFKRRKN